MQTTSHVVYTDLLSGGNISFWNSNVRAQLFWQARKHKHINKYAMHFTDVGDPYMQFAVFHSTYNADTKGNNTTPCTHH